VIEDVTGGLDVAAHTVFIISQSHSVKVSVKPTVTPLRKRLSWSNALRGMQHPGTELVKLEIYGFK